MKRTFATLTAVAITACLQAQTWQQLSYTYNWTPGSVPKIFVSPDDATLIAGVQSRAREVAVSKDGGTTWQQVFPGMAILTAEFGPDGTMYLATTKKYLTTSLYPVDTLYSSTDGLTWTNMGYKLKNGGSENQFTITGNNTLIFPNGSGNKMAKSTDNGTTWSDIEVGYNQIAASYTADTIISSSGSPWPGGISYSHDGGATFSASTGVNAECIPLVLPNGEVWAASLNKLWKSTDGGATFTGNSPNPSIPLQIQEIHYGSNGKFYVMSLGSVLETTDGITYTDLKGNLPAVMDIELSNNYIYVAGADSNIYRLPLTPGTSVAKHPMNPSLMKIYPNPATDQLHLSVDPGVHVQKLELFDQTGKLVKSVSQESSLDVSDLAKGMYILRVATNKESVTNKVIVQ